MPLPRLIWPAQPPPDTPDGWASLSKSYVAAKLPRLPPLSLQAQRGVFLADRKTLRLWAFHGDSVLTAGITRAFVGLTPDGGRHLGAFDALRAKLRSNIVYSYLARSDGLSSTYTAGQKHAADHFEAWMGASDVEAQENGELHLIDTFLKDLFSAEVWPAIAELKILVAPTTQHTPMGPSTLWGGAPNFVPQYFPHLPPPTVPSESQQLVSVVTDVVGKLLQGNVTKEYRKEALKKLGVSKTAATKKKTARGANEERQVLAARKRMVTKQTQRRDTVQVQYF